MNKKLLIFLIPIFFISCNSTQNNKTDRYEIQGFIKGFEKGEVKLNKLENNQFLTIDSAFVEEGKFLIKGGSIKNPEMCFLVFDENELIIPFFLENSKIKIETDINKSDQAVISGSKSQNELAVFMENNSVYENKIYNLSNQINLAKENNDTSLLKNIDSTIVAMEREQTDFIKKYVIQNNKTVVSAYITAKYLSNILNTKEGISVIDWEYADSRNPLCDLYNYFFTELYYGRAKGNNLISEINAAILRLNKVLVERLPVIADRLVRQAKIYRWIYYLERINVILEREPSDNSLDVLLRSIKIFGEIEEEHGNCSFFQG